MENKKITIYLVISARCLARPAASLPNAACAAALAAQFLCGPNSACAAPPRLGLNVGLGRDSVHPPGPNPTVVRASRVNQNAPAAATLKP